MKKEDIKEILRKHQLWLENKAGGERADFRNANFYRANLAESNLAYADLFRADLAGTNLTNARLIYADLAESNLYHADLNRADLFRADLNHTNLNLARLTRANLAESNLARASLIRANLAGANLARASLIGANLAGANLAKASLIGANLIETKLTKIKTNYQTQGIHPASEGELIGWGKKNGKLVKMLIPTEAKRSCTTTRKHRAEFAQVLWIEDGLDQVIVENLFGKTVYKIGQIVRCHEWEEDRWKECAGGIHFFLSREEAEAWRI